MENAFGSNFKLLLIQFEGAKQSTRLWYINHEKCGSATEFQARITEAWVPNENDKHQICIGMSTKWKMIIISTTVTLKVKYSSMTEMNYSSLMISR